MDAGDGGQARALIASQSGADTGIGLGTNALILAGCLGLALAAVAVLRIRRVR